VAESCYTTCVQNTKPICKAWAWTQSQGTTVCTLYFHEVEQLKYALNVVSGARDCHPYKGQLSRASRLEEAAYVSTASAIQSNVLKSTGLSSSTPRASTLTTWGGDLPSGDGPWVGMSAYKAVEYGAMAYHMAVWWMDDPNQLTPGDSSSLSNQYWTCADVGSGALENARDLSKLDVQGPVNVEISFSLGPDGGSDNLRHPALNTVLIGRHPSAVFESTPTYMGYVKAPEGLTLNKFLDTARETGSALLEMGGYDLTEGKDCQTFTVMMLMKLGLSGLTDVAVNSCINTIGTHRSPIKKAVPNDVATCSVIGTTGNFANYHPVFPGFDYDSCISACDEPVGTGVRIAGGWEFVDIVWCLPNVSKCSNTNCGHPGQAACYNGEPKCEGEQAYGFCVTSSEVPKNMMPSGDRFVSGGPLQCPSVGR